ncbi:19796_t:CDS:2 [Entrophospora sp. SA101]|nr:19796_t:CDS:2 [Entrophospora sp. SA101]
MNKLYSTFFFLSFFPIIIYSFPSPSLVKRVFASCDDTFPITFTAYTITPDPVVLGETITANIEGTNKDPIEAGTILQLVTSFQGTVKDTTNVDFCTEFKLTCPYAAGTFSYSNTTTFPAIPDAPKGQSVTLDQVINVLAADGVTKLGCEKGTITVTT